MKPRFKSLCALVAALLVAGSAVAADYDNKGVSATRASGVSGSGYSTQGMDCVQSTNGKYYVLSMVNYGYANLFEYNGSKLSGAKHFKLGSFNNSSSDTQNHSNLVNFSNTKWTSSDALPLVYVTRCNASANDKWGFKRVCYVEHIKVSESKSALVQIISIDDVVTSGGSPQFMLDGDYLYVFRNTKGNAAEGNKHQILKFRLPKPPVKSDGYSSDTDKKLPLKTRLTNSDLVYKYYWEDYYTGGANHTIQGGKVKDGLMYLPWGTAKSSDPSIIYVWNLDKRRMETEINLQGTATKDGTVKFPYELEDVSFGYPGRMLVQVNVNSSTAGKIYWINTSYLPKLRQNDWCYDVTPTAHKSGSPYTPLGEGYYYLKSKTNSGNPYWVNMAQQATSIDGLSGIKGQQTLHFTQAASVPGSGHDAAYMFHLMPQSATSNIYTIASCAVTGKPYVQQFLQSNDWSVMNGVATAPGTNWSKFIMARGNDDDSYFIKPKGTSSSHSTMRIWRRGNDANGITTRTLCEYNDNLNDFVWVPITDAQVLAYAKYCEQVSICLGLPTGTGAGQVRSAKRSQFQSWLKALNTTFSASANYGTLLSQVLEKKSWATSDDAVVTPSAPVTTLTAPANGTSTYSDFTFSCTNVGADTYTLQVSASSNFATVAQTGSMSIGSSAVTKAMSVSSLPQGTYYWRVLTDKSGCTQSVSGVWSFTITARPDAGEETGYVKKLDVDTYSPALGAQLTNLWVRSVKSQYGNITFASNGSLNRGFTVIGDRIYVAGRASDGKTSYVDIYDASTGQGLGKLDLGASAGTSYPCNDVLADEAGHLIATNLTANVSSKDSPLKLYVVNTTTGTASSMATLTATVSGVSKPRIDHCGIVGNISSGNYTVMAPIASSTKLVRWTVSGGHVTATEVFDPGVNLGIAPRITPISADEALVKGGNVNLYRYNFATKTITANVDGNKAIQPAGTNANGAAQFTLGGANYLVYPYAGNNGANGYQFVVARNGSGTAIGGYSKVNVFPAQGLGTVNNSEFGAPCVTRAASDGNSQLIYVYAPGNGLAAYQLTAAATPTYAAGDVNQDGQVNANDVSALASMVLGQATYDPSVADVNQDGQINSNDVSVLASLILGN